MVQNSLVIIEYCLAITSTSWLILTCRWQTRMKSANWTEFAAPCLLILDHNIDQRWRRTSLANAANRRNIPPYGFSLFRDTCQKEKQKMSKIIMRVNIYHHLLTKLQKSCYATALVENFVATFPETIFSHAASFCSLYCNFSASQSLANFIYIYSNQIYLPLFHVLQFL